MKILEWIDMDEEQRTRALERPQHRTSPALLDDVRSIVNDVHRGGWPALRSIASRIDGEEPQLVDVGRAAGEARASLDRLAVDAIDFAAANIRAFHHACMPQDVEVATAPGLIVRKVWRAIDRVGLYVPGGKTPLFSTLLMLAIPAAIAGVGEIIVVTPPRAGGGLDPVIGLAADICGIGQVWTVGGAQAIAALAFGAGKIGKVDKICGPGNAWVSEAKRLVSTLPGGATIDMPAGPSELMVIADSSANPRLVAADLLAQAEHDPAAQVMLVTTCRGLARKVGEELQAQLATIARQAIAAASLQSARLILAPDLTCAAEIANRYAPEHLALAVNEPDAIVPAIRNAGAVFSGSLAAETFGDYLAGSSHVLPTDGAARAWGGVSVHTFLKAMSVQSVTPEAARNIAGKASVLARLEGLEAHARAADARFETVR